MYMKLWFGYLFQLRCLQAVFFIFPNAVYSMDDLMSNRGAYQWPVESGLWDVSEILSAYRLPGPEYAKSGESFYLQPENGDYRFPVSQSEDDTGLMYLTCDTAQQWKDVDMNDHRLCRLSPGLHDDGEVMLFGVDEGEDAQPVGKTLTDCVFLLSQGGRFIVASQVLIRQGGETHTLECPVVYPGDEVFPVLAVDLSHVSGCLFAPQPASDKSGYFVRSAIVECASKSKSKHSLPWVSSQKLSVQSSSLPGSSGNRHHLGVGGSGSGGDGGDENGGAVNLDREPASAPDWSMDKDLFIAYLKYLLGSSRHLEQERGLMLLKTFETIHRSDVIFKGGDRDEQMDEMDEMASIITSIKDDPDSIGKNEPKLSAAFAGMSERNTRLWFDRAGHAERLLQLAGSLERVPWTSLYKKEDSDENRKADAARQRILQRKVAETSQPHKTTETVEAVRRSGRKIRHDYESIDHLRQK